MRRISGIWYGLFRYLSFLLHHLVCSCLANRLGWDRFHFFFFHIYGRDYGYSFMGTRNCLRFFFSSTLSEYREMEER